jgi:chromosome segregation ATPase
VPVAQANRKLIKDGSLNFKTRDLEKTKKDVAGICKTLNAYLSNESLNNFDDRISYHQTIRVPADQFEALVEQLEKLADKVENKNIHSRDVTEEFIDVETRLKNKTQVEARYRELLAQARTVEDMLSIERELGNVRQEIESTEGRLKYLTNQVAFSTLELSYYEVVGADFGFASKFVDSLADGWDNLLAFIIWLLTLWPFLILFGGIGWLIRKYWRRKAT